MGESGIASLPSCFNTREKAPSTHWIEGWVSLRAGLDVMMKRKQSLPLLGNEPQLVVQLLTIEREKDTSKVRKKFEMQQISHILL
jgi:hypothetical protein